MDRIKNFALWLNLSVFHTAAQRLEKLYVKLGAVDTTASTPPPIDGGKHGRQVLPADQQDGRTRYDFRHKGKHNGAGHGKQEHNRQADGDAGANGILLAPDLVGVVAKSGSPGRAGHAIGVLTQNH